VKRRRLGNLLIWLAFVGLSVACGHACVQAIDADQERYELAPAERAASVARW
jgi:hypothetical protein